MKTKILSKTKILYNCTFVAENHISHWSNSQKHLVRKETFHLPYQSKHFSCEVFHDCIIKVFCKRVMLLAMGHILHNSIFSLSYLLYPDDMVLLSGTIVITIVITICYNTHYQIYTILLQTPSHRRQMGIEVIWILLHTLWNFL